MANNDRPTAAEFALAEDILAQHGLICLSAEMHALWLRIEADPNSVTEEEWQAARYALHTSAAYDRLPPEGGSP
jgi:hypothetical protein